MRVSCGAYSTGGEVTSSCFLKTTSVATLASSQRRSVDVSSRWSEERPSHPHTTRTYLVAEIEPDDLKTSHRRPHQRVVVVTIAIAAAAVAAVAHRCGGVGVVVVVAVVGGGGGGGARVEEVARAKPRAAACDGEGGPTVGAVSVPRRSRVRPVPQPEMWRGRRRGSRTWCGGRER